MDTLESMAMAAAMIKEKLARNEKVPASDLRFLQSFNNLHSKKATNAGKRKIKNHNKNW